MTSSTPPPTGSQGPGFSEQPVGDPVQSCPLPELLVDGVDEEPPQIDFESEVEDAVQLEFVGEVEELAQPEFGLDSPEPAGGAPQMVDR